MRSPALLPSDNWKPIDKNHAIALGLTTVDLAPTHDIADIGLVLDSSVWVEIPLSGGWMAAFRLANQRGQPIVAELRLFPEEDDRKVVRRTALLPQLTTGAIKGIIRRPPGEWSGEYGMAKNIKVPVGGVTARLLRTIRVKLFKDVMRTIIERLKKGEIERSRKNTDSMNAITEHIKKGRLSDRRKDLLNVEMESLKKETGFLDLLASLDVGLTSSTVAPSSGRGRKPRPDSELAQMASVYESAYLENKSPISAIAKRFRLSSSQARDVIFRARMRGILTPAEKQGSAGGVLTPHARALLNQPKNKTSIAHQTKRRTHHGKKR